MSSVHRIEIKDIRPISSAASRLNNTGPKILHCETPKNIDNSGNFFSPICTYAAGNYMFKVNNRNLEQGVKYIQSQQ